MMIIQMESHACDILFQFKRNIIVLLRDVFHIGLVIGPRPALLAWGAAERQYSRPRTYN